MTILNDPARARLLRLAAGFAEEQKALLESLTPWIVILRNVVETGRPRFDESGTVAIAPAFPRPNMLPMTMLKEVRETGFQRAMYSKRALSEMSIHWNSWNRWRAMCPKNMKDKMMDYDVILAATRSVSIRPCTRCLAMPRFTRP